MLITTNKERKRKAMQTGACNSPVKNQSDADNYNNEDSQVFDFIQALSPIKPVKPVRITQTVPPIGLSTPSFVFTSPQAVSKHEQRIQNANAEDELDSHPQQDVPSHHQITCHANQSPFVGVTSLDEYMSSRPQSEECAHRFDAPVVAECSGVGLCGQSSTGTAVLSAPIVPMLGEDHEQLESSGVKYDDETKKGLYEWDWANPLSESNHMLMFSSSHAAEAFGGLVSRSPYQNPVLSNSMMPRLIQSEVANVGETHLVSQMNPCQQHHPSSLIQLMDNGITTRDHPSVNYPDVYVAMSLQQNFQYNPTPGFYGGLRRSLEFEMAGANKNYDPQVSSDYMQLPDVWHHGEDSSSRVVIPGIGLHRNATTMNPNALQCEHLSANTRCTTTMISPVCLELPRCTRVPHNGPLMLNTSQEGVLLVKDDSSAYLGSYSEEQDQRSIQRKRYKVDNPGGKGTCKRCNCKKSQCVKLYCECFAAGEYCTDPCACQHCLNKPIHSDIILETRKRIESRNPRAFDPKIITDRNSSDANEVESSKTPASCRHKKGCNCKKSACTKKYCECYQSGVGCSFNCRCEGCKNSLGRRDASTGAITDSVAHHLKKEVHPTGPSTSSSHLSTFSHAAFTSTNKRSRSSSPTNRHPLKTYFRGSCSKSENHSFTRSVDDEVPTILLNCINPPSYGLKSSSPNSKRVSPPNEGKASLGTSSDRRVRLKSIPSFPSL